jgi:thymidylate synthase
MSQSQPPHNHTPDEESYISLVREILSNGYHVQNDRTGKGTYEMIGKTLRFSLEKGTLPLLTTKKINPRNIVLELIMFLRGITDSKFLSSRGVNIWNANSKDEHGELGPVYGFQWRHYGSEYRGKDFSHSGLGIDQLENVIDSIRKDKPEDKRRLVVSAWNPKDIPEMALPPCHCLFQFVVQGEDLTCILYQRSADVGLGVPYNIASYALLTHIVAKMTGKKAKELVHVMGSAHVYSDHVEGLKKQVQRNGYAFPKISFKEGKNWDTVDDVEEEDIVVEGYQSCEFIKLEMSGGNNKVCENGVKGKKEEVNL